MARQSSKRRRPRNRNPPPILAILYNRRLLAHAHACSKEAVPALRRRPRKRHDAADARPSALLPLRLLPFLRQALRRRRVPEVARHISGGEGSAQRKQAIVGRIQRLVVLSAAGGVFCGRVGAPDGASRRRVRRHEVFWPVLHQPARGH